MTRASGHPVVAPAFISLQQKRRDEALERQRHARNKHINLSRLVSHAEEHAGTAAPEDTVVEHMAVAAPQEQQASEASPEPSATTSSRSASMPADTDMASQKKPSPRNRHRGQRKSQPGNQNEAGPSGPVGQSGRGRHNSRDSEHPRQFWSRQLQNPEWMTDVPADLATHWLVLPRPEGPRCLVVTGRGHTIVRNRGGSVLFQCLTALPEGGPASLGSTKDFCVLDAVWHEPNSTLYVLDLLVWRGYALYDCTAEFRAFWLQSKLQEDPDMAAALLTPPVTTQSMATEQVTQTEAAMQDVGGADQGLGTDACMDACGQPASDDMEVAQVEGAGTSVSGGQGQARGRRRAGRTAGVDHAGQHAAGQRMSWLRVVPLPVHPASVAGLQAAYQGGTTHPCSFQQDGLHLLHKDSQYNPGHATPLALSWKDGGCSQWPLDTDPQGGALPHQVITLEFRMDCSVATQDEPPVVLGTMPQAWVQAMGPQLLRPGRLLKFTLREGGIQWAPDGRPAGADLHYDGPANQRRGRADCFSKILFQHLARTQPSSWQVVLQQAAQSEQAAATAAETGSMTIE